MASSPALPRSPQPGRRYFQGAAAILFLTGFAKLFSSLGTAEIFETLDPVFILKFRYVLIGVGLAEVVVGAVLLLSRDWRVKALLTVCLASGFAVYRIGLMLMGFDHLCPCLGSAAKSLGIPDRVANALTMGALLYLLLGSMALLLTQWWRSRLVQPTVGNEPPHGHGPQAVPSILSLGLWLAATSTLLAATPTEIVTQLKQHLENPPAIAEIEFIRHMPGTAEPKAGITDYAYFFGRWQPNGYLVREVSVPDGKKPWDERCGYFSSRYDDFAWSLMQVGHETNLTVWFPPVPRTGRFPYVQDWHTNSLLDAYHLGISFLTPGTLKWQGADFTAKAWIKYYKKEPVEEQLSGHLTVSAAGLPAELRYKITSQSAGGERRCRLHYETSVGPAFFPSRIEIRDLEPGAESVVWTLHIQRLALATTATQRSAFDPGRYYQTNAMTMTIITNDTMFALTEEGLFERARDPSELVGPEGIHGASILRWSLLGIAFVALAGFVWLRCHTRLNARKTS